MNQWKKAGIVCCSDPLPDSFVPQIEKLCQVFASMGLSCVRSTALFSSDFFCENPMKKKADALLQMMRDPSVSVIFDVSGGDLTNGILPYLDFGAFSAYPKLIFGYSDVTALLNAVYQMTGVPSVLYSVKNLIGKDADVQIKRFSSFLHEASNMLFSPEWSFVQGEKMTGVLIGGNIRCLLKLAGTPYFPAYEDAVLLLESRSGDENRIRAYFDQLLCMGVFSKVSGVLLGTFTELERICGEDAPQRLLRSVVRDSSLTIAKTQTVGHGSDSYALPIGMFVSLCADGEKAVRLQFAHHSDYDIIPLH